MIVVNAGMYSQYLALTGKATLEPRAGIKWNLDEKNALSLGYGNHSQMEELRIYFASVTDKNGASSQPNKNLTFSRAHHFVIGYDRKLGDNLRVKIEPYFQYLYNIPIIEDSTESLINFAQNWFIKDKYINKGTGKNYGIDITLERFLSHNMYFLVTGSVFEAKFGGTSGSSYNSRFNRNYVANVLFGKEFYVGHEKQNIIGINARISYRGGDRSYYINHAQSLAAKEIIYDYSRPFERRLPDLLGSDITLTYRKNKKYYSSEWALQVKNAFGSLDNYSDYYNLQTHQVVEQEGMKITVPSISYKIEF
jgi:hypothetical protein